MKKKVSIFLMLLFIIGAVVGQNQRDPWLWPFAQNSIWNMPIGSNAVYVNANIGAAGFVGVDKEYMYKVPEGSPVRNIYGPHTWNDRCPTEDADKYQGQMRIMDNLLMPDATASETPNNVATFLQPGGSSLISLAPFTRCTEGGTVFGWKRPDLDIKGEGITGAHWGSGLSGFGGSIRKGELLGSEPIRHVLKIDIWGQKYLYYASDRLGYRWPATNADGYANETWGYMRQDPQLSNPNKAMVQGSLLAIPPSVSEASLNLVTAPAKKLFKALQDYGAYIVDDAAWDANYICAEDGVTGETEAQYGISMGGYSGNFHDDINKLFQALKVVDNNAPDNIGGGGTPRAALAPPFQPDGTPPTIKIMPLGDSHTHGQNGAPSYRGPLRKLLMDNGYTNIDFVGPQYDVSPGDYVPTDANHAGFAGFTIGPSNLGYSIMQSIDWIMQSDPDIILLELGVNDNWNEDQHGANYAATMPARYENLVKKILELKPGVKILTATLLPVKWDLNWSNSGNNLNLNQKIEALPATYSNVKFVDMYEKMLAVVNVNGDYNDDIHFNQTGYGKVAQVWYDVITPLLSTSTNTCNGNGTGLGASYFNNKTLTGTPILSRTDATINYDWGAGSPASGVNADNISARWSGQIQACYTETYTFETETDDGVRLWVNGVQLINKWVNQGPTKWTGTINLTAGQKYDIKMEYYENGGGAIARLRWSSPSQSKVIIPASQLYPSTVTVPSVINMGFEADAAIQTPTGWSEWQNAGSSYTEIGGGSHGGTYHLTHWNSSAYEVSTFQTINNLPNGTYTLSAYVLSSGGQQNCQMGVYGYGGDERYINLPVISSTWTLIEIPNIEVTSGQLTIDLYTLGNAGNWSCYDDVSLTLSNQASSIKSAKLTQESKVEVAVSLRAYPVPFTDRVTIKTSGFSKPIVTVYNMLGVVVMKKQLDADIVELLTTDLPGGIYIISVKDIKNERKIQVTK